MFKKEYIILVDENDNEIGIGEKLKVHQEAKLHRAFSIFIFNSKGELLIQKRADSKYHCGGLWSNTVCSHPRANEQIEDAIHRRLKQEMDFDCPLKKLFKFHYKVKFDNSLTENEIDTVFIGKYDGEVKINKEEASDFKWISLEDLEKDIKLNNEKYTIWFKIALKKIIDMEK
ncbi:MAG: isopentenyl-diphosphate Delta-isomerase [archaeon]